MLPDSKKSRSFGEVNLMTALAIFLGVGTLLFGILAIVEFSSASHANRTLQSAVSAAHDSGYQQGQADQKEADLKADEAPFQSYIAPGIFGSFNIRFPKNWSATVAENQASFQQIDLTAHPVIIKLMPNPQSDVDALHFQLANKVYTDSLKVYQDLQKAKKVTLSDADAAGIRGTKVVGKFDSVHDGIMVLIPVRDKTAYFFTDDKKYEPEFDQILAQSQIAP